MLIYSETFYRAEKSFNGHLKFHGHAAIGTAHVFLPPFNLTLSCIKDQKFTTIHSDIFCLSLFIFFFYLGRGLDFIYSR